MAWNAQPAPKVAMDPEAAERYELECRLARHFGGLTTASQRRVLEIIESLSFADARKVAAYAQSLADWPDPDASSP